MASEITQEKRLEIKQLFKEVKVSQICAELGIKRWRVYAALNNEARNPQCLEDLLRVIAVARVKSEETNSVIQVINNS
ncbi:hypothetical protein [Chitinophaga sp. sic0106]|uniref:hypothetical protein n=1 Tax=Chitinophaga sp. sic0106 TaxID=2854785 RepID=UPI001C438301|nr:hypothetical protein [Chitinophaga sp. sic0106]MBV7529019.1 hypothetical protein [Chitinophaga sp. sic0106]